MPSFTLQPHTKHILFASSIVVVPMITFTVVILVLVFHNLASDLDCPYSEICPQSPLINVTKASHYHVDYPATRLVFVSSWSSTVSFALVSALMSIYAYCAARQLTEASVSQDQSRCLPTSYETSLVVRLLNADYLSLWELSRPWRRWSFRRGTKSNSPGRATKPTVLRASIFVLCLAVFASVLVHAADGYLHIATEAIELVQVFPQDPAQHQYGRRIDPWCLDDSETVGTMQNRKFWGCSMTTLKSDEERMDLTNNTEFNARLDEGYGKGIMNFTEGTTGRQYAVVGPMISPSETDWQATSYAISSQCAPIPATACDIEVNSNVTNDLGLPIVPFDCSIARGSPIDFSGGTIGDSLLYTFFDFHKHLSEDGKSFGRMVGLKFHPEKEAESIIPNITKQESAQMFPSTWRWNAAVSLHLDIHGDDLPRDMIGKAWPLWPAYGGYDMVVACNTTVYDVTYSATGGTIKRLDAHESNSTVAGISILPSVDYTGYLGDLKYSVSRYINPPVSLGQWMSDLEVGMSTLFALPLLVHTVPADSILVQTRARKIMTRAPVAAVWLLVLANLFFAALGIGLAVMAWMAADQDVHQVRTRLGVPGLAAALFERNSENRIVKYDKELYQENDKDGLPLVLVGVQHTVTGGMAWSLRDNQTGRPCLADGAKMSTAHISDTTRSTSEETTGAENFDRISESSGNEAVEHQPISIVPSEPVTQFDAVSPIEQPNHWV